MKHQKVWTIAVFISVGIASLFVSHRILSQDINPQIQTATMPAVIIHKPLMLQAWEEDPNYPPLGAPPDPNRPTSYALLSVTFENTTLNPIEIKIKSVTVQLSDTKETFLSSPESILTLGPLEV